MSEPSSPLVATARQLNLLQRLQNWWQSQTAPSQDRLTLLASLIGVLLFLVAILSAFAYLRLEETVREREAIYRDVEYAQKNLHMRLLNQQEQLLRLAREISDSEPSAAAFRQRAETFSNQFLEIQSITWLDQDYRLRGDFHASGVLAQHFQGGSHEHGDSEETARSFLRLSQSLTPVYARPHRLDNGQTMVQLHLPLSDKIRFKGDLIVNYSLNAIFRYGVPPEIAAKYAFGVLDEQGQLLDGSAIVKETMGHSFLPWTRPISSYELPLEPIGHGLSLRGQAYRTSLGLIGNSLFWLAAALSAATAWLLLANWRHNRRRIRTQDALERESAFRRAMENSMLTGLRVLDLQGRITYVNAAFCQMTGWSKEDLLNKSAPFPYWPDEDHAILYRRLKEKLAGQIAPRGTQFRIKRKDGSTFEAHLYVSPLIDMAGKQTGWMTSVTDVTESTRVREQLAAAHERFTAVLQALDAAISVVPLGSHEMLFANKLYRLWFGAEVQGHIQLVTEAGVPTFNPGDETSDQLDTPIGLLGHKLSSKEAGSREIYLSSLGRWLEVRTRYLSWVDGRLAQMVIATDISARRLAKEQSEIQAERARTSSRLITMGEMASSVAHELNQPLTAISNYCNGMMSRLKNRRIEVDELLAVLEKTSHQAQRAAQIIDRIRSFVKRSEPNRSPTPVATLIWEATELAEIELRRRNVKFSKHIAADLPDLLVDPILIEQVLLNLLKNAAESIDAAQRPAPQRLVELRVASALINDKPAVEFKVIDSGQGIAPEVMTRLYEAFYSTKPEGMGIGLSLCRSIVESHLGRMKVENIYNQDSIVGCCFTFWIPKPQPSSSNPDDAALA